MINKHLLSQLPLDVYEATLNKVWLYALVYLCRNTIVACSDHVNLSFLRAFLRNSFKRPLSNAYDHETKTLLISSWTVNRIQQDKAPKATPTQHQYTSLTTATTIGCGGPFQNSLRLRLDGSGFCKALMFAFGTDSQFSFIPSNTDHIWRNLFTVYTPFTDLVHHQINQFYCVTIFIHPISWCMSFDLCSILLDSACSVIFVIKKYSVVKQWLSFFCLKHPLGT